MFGVFKDTSACIYGVKRMGIFINQIKRICSSSSSNILTVIEINNDCKIIKIIKIQMPNVDFEKK